VRSRLRVHACRAFKREFSVSHRVWWRWTETGKAWWIELTFDNRTSRGSYGGTDGSVRVTGLLEDPFGWGPADQGPGRPGVEHWGGSSADYLAPPRGVTRQIVAPGIDQDVHTTADGTIEITRINVYLAAPGSGEDSCLLPVPERS
jgi:hypothetical protein